ncbi:MAG: hypothetical protein AAF488_05545 [Planctomycetota bacterium]
MELELDFAGSLDLRFRAQPETMAIARATLRLATSNLDLRHRFRCFGFDLEQFADSLRVFHNGSAEAAKFESFDGSTRIEFSYEDARFGALRTAVELGAMTVEPDFRERQHFRGTSLNQSSLVTVASRIDAFLLETGLDTHHPHSIGDRLQSPWGGGST